MESRSDDDGSRVMRWSPSAGITQVAYGVGSEMHAYGGGVFTPSHLGVWWVSGADGQIWLGDRRITSGSWQYGDLCFADGLLLAVREGSAGDELVSIDARSFALTVLRRAAFIASPTLQEGRVAWVEWPSDAMPWDHAEVWTATIERPERSTCIAGGAGEAATQPSWGPDGRLYLMSDRSGWWNLYRTARDGIEAIAPMGAECTDALWELGYRSVAHLASGRIALLARNGPDQHLVVREPDASIRTLPLPYTSFKPYLVELNGTLALIAATSQEKQQIILVEVESDNPPMIIRGDPSSAADVSLPEILTIDSSGQSVTLLLYRPSGEHGSGRRPLIVRAHPGPTHQAETRLDPEIQYFTRRGFAVADVDYHGSTGYGRAFRTSLNGQWGELDVADCISAADALIKSDVADPETVFVSGSSAGGYTALRAVARRDTPFALAVARSAIVDPRTWTLTAPRFQRAHAATLSHDSANVDPAAICRPVLLIHGLADHVAPAEDTRSLATALNERGLLSGYLPLPGVGHYLSGTNVERAALEAELAAYERVLTSQQQADRE
ncbi:prolyl oligopeptidase family serine peptidase [Phytomonospora sp. NPDC050363]|uniref:S9 family peptidase n=1 Tax=Phytomonospora sp. NPDC050363 TaxID=3155642 RepID=UPI0033F5BC35